MLYACIVHDEGKGQVHQNHFHQKHFFIKNHFHQKPLSTETTFIENQFHQNTSCQRDPPPEQKQYCPCLCESVVGQCSAERPAEGPKVGV